MSLKDTVTARRARKRNTITSVPRAARAAQRKRKVWDVRGSQEAFEEGEEALKAQEEPQEQCIRVIAMT